MSHVQGSKPPGSLLFLLQVASKPTNTPPANISLRCENRAPPNGQPAAPRRRSSSESITASTATGDSLSDEAGDGHWSVFFFHHSWLDVETGAVFFFFLGGE